MRNIIVILIFLIIIPISPANASDSDKEYDLMVLNSDLQSITTGKFIRESLKDIGIKINLIYRTQDFFNRIFQSSIIKSDIKYDMLVYKYNTEESGIKSIPSLVYFKNYKDRWINELLSYSEWNSVDYSNFIKKLEYSDIKQFNRQLDLFNQLFMEEFLFTIPLFNEYSMVTAQRGLGGLNNNNWNANQDIIEIIRKGLEWDNSLNNRIDNRTHFNIEDDGKVNFDFLMDPLLYFDDSFLPHPALAYQTYQENIPYSIDTDNDPTTTNVTGYKYSFIIRDNVYWLDNNILNYSNKLDANDFVLSIIALQNQHSLPFYNFTLPNVIKLSVETTVNTNDTLTIYTEAYNTNNLLTLGSLKPLNYDLFSGDLNINNSFFDIRLDKKRSIWGDLKDTDVWKEALNNSNFIGPFYEINSSVLKMRDNYYYPKQSDINNYYTKDVFRDIEVSSELDMSVFAPMIYSFNKQYYWENNSTYIIHKVKGNSKKMFKLGKLDFVDTLILDDYFVSKVKYENSMPISLFFNFENSDLRNFNLRSAISHAINREQLGSIYSNILLAGNPLNSRFYKYKNINVLYDIQLANKILNEDHFSLDNQNINNKITTEKSIMIIIIILMRYIIII